MTVSGPHLDEEHRQRFAGPAHLAPAWARFVSEYSMSGALSRSLRNAQALQTLAFTDSPPAITTDAERQRMKRGLEDAMLALTSTRDHGGSTSLHAAIVSGLFAKWRQAQQAARLWPPEPARTASDRSARNEARRRLLATPQGNLLAGLLRVAEEPAIRAEALSLHRRYPGIAQEDILELATDRFENALFAHDPAQASFVTFLRGDLRRYLGFDIQQQFPGTTGRARETRLDDAVLLTRMDTRQPFPDAALLQSEERQKLLEAVTQLSEEERDVLTLRFGLKDGVSRTLDETGAVLGKSRWSVLRTERAAMNRCRRLMGVTDTATITGRGAPEDPSDGHRTR